MTSRAADEAEDIQRIATKLLRTVTDPTVKRELEKIKRKARDLDDHLRHGHPL
jgi:Holliday junction resolvasome RuvABC ATP-dependent DNA helicase subunit